MIKNCVYSIPVFTIRGKIYKGETRRPLKVRLEEYRKAVVRGEIEKSGMVDYTWKEKGKHLPLWGEVEIIDRAEHWRTRHLKESAHCNASRINVKNNDVIIYGRSSEFFNALFDQQPNFKNDFISIPR